MVEQELPSRSAFPFDVQRLDVLDNWSIGRTRVLEVEGPLHSGEIVVFNSNTTHDQTALKVGVSQRVLGAGIKHTHIAL